MGAGRLQEAARILDVALPFFFEGTDEGSYKLDSSTPSHAYINEFTASSEGLRLVKAFTRIARPAIRHRIVMLRPQAERSGLLGDDLRHNRTAKGGRAPA
jgi:hypothetical protein